MSTGDLSLEAQRHALGGNFDTEYEGIGVWGGIMAGGGPGFAERRDQVRKGDRF